MTLKCRKATSCFLFEYLLVLAAYLSRKTVSLLGCVVWVLTHICMSETSSSPFGSTTNKNEDTAIANNRAIVHDDRKAVTLFTLAYVVCMVTWY